MPRDKKTAAQRIQEAILGLQGEFTTKEICARVDALEPGLIDHHFADAEHGVSTTICLLVREGKVWVHKRGPGHQRSTYGIGIPEPTQAQAQAQVIPLAAGKPIPQHPMIDDTDSRLARLEAMVLAQSEVIKINNTVIDQMFEALSKIVKRVG